VEILNIEQREAKYKRGNLKTKLLTRHQCGGEKRGRAFVRLNVTGNIIQQK